MKLINVDINDEIIFKNVVDVDTGVITGISSTVKLPTGNYNNIILNFSFANQKLCEDFNIFASFKINNGTPIVQELAPMEIGNINYTHTCYIPNEVFQDKCEVALGVYGYRLNDDETLDKRFSLVPVRNFVIEGSYDPDSTESIVPTPTVFEIYFDKINKAEEDCQAMLEQTAIEVDAKLNAIQTDYDTFKAEKEAEVNDFLNNAEGQFMGTVNQLETDFAETQALVNQMETSVNNMETAVNNMQPTVANMEQTLPLKQDKLTFDSAPTEGSINPVTSGGVATALASLSSKINCLFTNREVLAMAKGSYALNDSIENYDFILVLVWGQSNASVIKFYTASGIFPVDFIKLNGYEAKARYAVDYYSSSSTYTRVQFGFDAPNSIYIDGIGSNGNVPAIYGIKI